MIEAKGTKENPAGSESPRERYLHIGAEKRSRWPIALGLFLTGLAAYLKSMFPAAADPEKAAERPDGTRDDQGMDLAAQGAGSPEQAPADPDGTAGPASDADPSAPADPDAVDVQPIGKFMPADTPAIDFWDFGSIGPRTLDAGMPLIRPQAVNDNVSPHGGGAGNIPLPSGAGASARADDAEEDDADDDPGQGEPPGEGEDDDDGSAPPQNRAPTTNGVIYLHGVSGLNAVPIALSVLLARASDPDGDTLRVTNLSVSSGELAPAQDGWLYTPADGASDKGFLTYDVTDGKASVSQIAFFGAVDEPLVIGSTADDVLYGSDGDGFIDGRDGDDDIDGRDGDDMIAGGSGGDHVFAGDGDDVAFGQAGNDTVFGGEGNDRLFGGEGDDTIFGEEGDDLIQGGTGADKLMGGEGADAIHGDGGDDLLQGDHGDDLLRGGSGNDTVQGGYGNDRLSGGAGADLVSGGIGDDHVEVDVDLAADRYDGGFGMDTLDFSGIHSAVSVNLIAGRAAGFGLGLDTIASFEKVIGGSGDDTFTVGATATVLKGGDGNDRFVFSPVTRSPDDPAVIHEILDLVVGDCIVVGPHEIFKAEDISEDERFGQVYDENAEHDRPFRFRHEVVEGKEYTLIESCAEAGPEYDFSISIHGHHRLYIGEVPE